MKPLFVIRPEPGCSATVDVARALGLAVTGAPLFVVRPCAWSLPQGRFDAVLAGSANAFRHGGARLAELRALPVLAVGTATAEAARAAGFAVAMVGSGGLQDLLDRRVVGGERLLRLAGRDRVDLVPPPGTAITECVVYASDSLPLPADFAASLGQGSVVLLHSAAAARHFGAECDRLGIARNRIELAAIGPRVAQACGPGWAELACADTPDDTALLALAQVLCEK